MTWARGFALPAALLAAIIMIAFAGVSAVASPAFELRRSTDDEIVFVYRLKGDPAVEQGISDGGVRVRFRDGVLPATPGCGRALSRGDLKGGFRPRTSACSCDIRRHF